jgi:long-chain acyl-CoA synthetase
MIADQRKFPTALIVPDFTALRAEAERMGVSAAEDATLCRDARLIARVKAEVDQVAREFAPHERIKRIALIDHDFSVAEGELTPTLKLKRKAISDKFKAVIDAMYEGTSPEE